MVFERFRPQSKDVEKEPLASATQEIDWAVEAFNKAVQTSDITDWGESMNCLEMCSGALKNASNDDKEHVKEQLAKIKKEIDKVPETHNSIIGLVEDIENNLG